MPRRRRHHQIRTAVPDRHSGEDAVGLRRPRSGRPRLAELVALAEALYHAFDKAGPAILEYADAQTQAQVVVRQGIAAEERLKELIAPIAATQSRTVRESDALRQWHDLREATDALDHLMEMRVRDAIDRIRARAQTLWYQATEASDGHKYHIGPPIAPPVALDSTSPYDLTAMPTERDKVNYALWTAGGVVAALLLAEDAGKAYLHYLDGSGADRRIDYEEAYAEDNGIRRVVDAEILSAQREAERLYAETGQAAFQMSGQVNWAKDLVGGDYP